ncbi:DUF4060 family protein [Klebsiella aerogenes]|nr:DUF4060 family protein [Klebsiella aerogenes]
MTLHRGTVREFGNNRRCSYVATAMSCARRLQHLPGQCN